MYHVYAWTIDALKQVKYLDTDIWIGVGTLVTSDSIEDLGFVAPPKGSRSSVLDVAVARDNYIEYDRRVTLYMNFVAMVLCLCRRGCVGCFGGQCSRHRVPVWGFVGLL